MTIFNSNTLIEITQQFGTPAWIYDAATIRQQIKQLRNFDVIRFAQKACSNTHILRLMREEGVMVDAVSAGEIERSLAAGYSNSDNPESIVFTADVIDRETLALVIQHDIPVNIGSMDMLHRIAESSPRHPIWIRVNPGFGHGHSEKTNTGGPNSKHGISLEDLPQAISLVNQYGLDLIGIHMHIGSGSDLEHLSQACQAMIDTVKFANVDIRAISTGGGLPTPYSKNDSELDTKAFFGLWDEARKEIENHLGHDIKLEVEPGRFLVASAGVLVAEIHCLKSTAQHHFVLVDAGFNDLLRPSMYGSYHEIEVLHQSEFTDQIDTSSSAVEYAVAGPLCESGDVFTQDASGVICHQALDKPRVGDLLVFNDVGAYGASMSSNYNSRPLAPEILVDKGLNRLVRKRQNIRNLLALEDV
ncbi:diaminopimelate decarboxylase [Marinomonas rhizomae]|uniref:Diaminopimelate decarboxylase n=1 Tax=Marinomonas rhizomae TaxID=491948 RepID=A0A366J146_9GAMM|nr:diaminopimelate decarboxylase [Marinomonas rhizomae]RBP80567.1 diaminopimelate decarboxylase [Marinomonas rhizomae]RNF71800.1 diaminopimelate decarboxylase [Marinomonas rhizomae]